MEKAMQNNESALTTDDIGHDMNPTEAGDKGEDIYVKINETEDST